MNHPIHYYANLLHESSENFDSLLLSHINWINNSIDCFVLSVGLCFAFFLHSLLFLLFLYSQLGLKNTCVSANPTDPVFFVPILQFLLSSRKKKNKKIFMPTDPNIFQKTRQTTFKKIRIAQIMLKITFFSFLYVLYFIIYIFSSTVNDI